MKAKHILGFLLAACFITAPTITSLPAYAQRATRTPLAIDMAGEVRGWTLPPTEGGCHRPGG